MKKGKRTTKQKKTRKGGEREKAEKGGEREKAGERGKEGKRREEEGKNQYYYRYLTSLREICDASAMFIMFCRRTR